MFRYKYVAIGCVLVICISVIMYGICLMFRLKSPVERPAVQTPLGKLVGLYKKSYEGRTCSVFEGIPYAKPPVGSLRFQEAQPVVPWNGTLMLNRRDACVQLVTTESTENFLGSEDCLYLNIYVPRKYITGDENLNVVVCIHGGGFMFGDATDSLNGPGFIMDRDLVYVTIAFRIGVLGFLSTQDEIVPGNNGMKDQVLALKWIKDNIKYFGGNPNSITLTGVSAGAACVHYHYLSPLTKGLFHRGFSQSGVALHSWSLTPQPLEQLLKLASYTNCSYQKTLDIVKCLRNKPLQGLMAALHKYFMFHNLFPATPFGIVIEKEERGYLPDNPYRLLLEGRIHPYPWVAANTAHEGTTPLEDFPFEFFKEVEIDWKIWFPMVLNYNKSVDSEDMDFVSTQLKDFYLKNKSLTGDGLENFVDLFSDRWFLVESELAVRLHAKFSQSKVYYYIFDYIREKRSTSPFLQIGAGHTEDVVLLYNKLDDTLILPDSDRQLKDCFIDFLDNYAASPSVLSFNNVKWSPVTSSKLLDYLHIRSPHNISMRSVEQLAPTAFWDSLLLHESQHLYRDL